MPISIRPFRRFSVQCSVTCYAGRFQRQDAVRNISPAGSRLSGDLPMRTEEILSLTVSLLNEQCIRVAQAVVWWSRGQEFAVENVMVERHTHARLQLYMKELVQELTEIVR